MRYVEVESELADRINYVIRDSPILSEEAYDESTVKEMAQDYLSEIMYGDTWYEGIEEFVLNYRS